MSAAREDEAIRHADAAWHLIAGPTGAGKTTYGRALAERVGGICFSVDTWMNQLFWPDLPEKNDFGWAVERVGRCETQAATVAAQLAQRGMSSVLDFGLTTRAQRESWVQRAKGAGVGLELHTLELPAEARWSRVQRRNDAAEGTFVFPVTRTMFEDMERFWESPDSEEAAGYFRFHRIKA